MTPGARDLRRRSVQEVVTEDSQIAAAVRAELAARIGSQRYELWFGPHTQLCVGEDCLTVRAATAFVRDWLRRHFANVVQACYQAVVGRELPVEFQVDSSLSEAAESASSSESAETHCNPEPTSPQSAQRTRRRCGEDGGTRIQDAEKNPASSTQHLASSSPQHTGFANFVVGPSNEYAYRSAQLAVAPGSHKPSPLLFHGPTGVGKTHLLRAVRVEYLRRHRRARAVYLTAEQFTTEFVQAVRGSGLPSFRQKSRGADLLLIDDLQFFAGKRATLEELLHTLDALVADGRVLVLASDRGLAELSARGGLGPELISRLAGGLACELQPPEFATRLGILHGLCAEMALELSDEMLRMVATQITAGGRELRGALLRLQAMSLAFDEPISRDMAERALADLALQSARSVRLADVEQAVCHVFGVEPNQLRSQRKGRSVSEPRMLAMWLARKYTRAPWSEIGQFFGRRSHSTVISAHRRVERLLGQQARIDLTGQHCTVEEAIRRVEAALRSA